MDGSITERRRERSACTASIGKSERWKDSTESGRVDEAVTRQILIWHQSSKSKKIWSG